MNIKLNIQLDYISFIFIMHTKCSFGICKKKNQPIFNLDKGNSHTWIHVKTFRKHIAFLSLVIGSTNKACTLPTLTYSTYSKNDSINQQDCFAQWCVV